jgi:cytochrome c-type biogenesis protein CcmE
MTRKQRRLALIGTALAVLGVAAALVLNALKDSIVFFNSPTEVVEKPTKPGTRIRIGGLVKPGTVVHAQPPDVLTVHFDVTDGNKDVPVAYTGALPDLFREGQGVVAEGTLQSDGQFKADVILAKHDERYMPKEVVDALKKQGRWQESAGGAAPATQDALGAVPSKQQVR